MWEISEFGFFLTLIVTVGTIYQDLKRLNAKVDHLMEIATRGSESR